MQTLIELYDERPLENVLSTEMFRPARTVFLCPPEIARSAVLQRRLRQYFAHRGVRCECVFIAVSMTDTAGIAATLSDITEKYPDCALDIAGGTDAALFASGVLCGRRNIPVFTYSRKRNAFYEIQNAAFARSLPCTLRFTVEDWFLMAGGAMRPGRVDNAALDEYSDLIPPLFKLFLRYRRQWPAIVTFMQRVSAPVDDAVSLTVDGAYQVKGPYGRRIDAPEQALRDMADIGLIAQLTIEPGERIAFRFRDEQVRFWLRDVGSALELHVYQACRETGAFDDVYTSAIVDWEEGESGPDSVSNELDVVATSGVRPVFISCKACQVKTEALNELAVLRDRFGGQIARAAIVTAEQGGAAMRRRAMELGIDVIDLNDLKSGALPKCLTALLR